MISRAGCGQTRLLDHRILPWSRAQERPENAGLRRLPAVAGNGRGRQIALVTAFAMGQAGAIALSAFATRDAFAALRAGVADAPLAPFILIVLAGLLLAAFRLAERITAERVGQSYSADLRMRLFTHLSRMPSSAVGDKRAGGLSLRFVGDLTAAKNWVSRGIARMISASITLPIACVVLFLLDVSLGLAASPFLALGVLAMVVAAPRLGPAHTALRSSRARLAADLFERAPIAPQLRLMGRIPVEKNLLRRRTEIVIADAMARVRALALLRIIPDIVAGVTAAAVLFSALRQGIPAPEAAGALAALGLTIKPLRDLAGVWDQRRAWIAARDKCARLLAQMRLPTAARGKTKCTLSAPPDIVFDNVTAGPLRDFSATIHAGETVAIAGRNGSGKSTLLSLAAGLDKPANGNVLLDNQPVLSLHADARRKILLSNGSSPILAGSLRRALVLGAIDLPNDTKILKVAAKFGLEPLVERLHGLNGKIGEGGRGLSAGEKRRLFLARAVLVQPTVLLLDEPDDALDHESFELSAYAMSHCHSTTILVSHNENLVELADRRVTLN